MNSKRIFCILLCLTLTGLCAFAAGKTDSGGGASNVVTLQYADWDKFDTGFIDEWNRTHPNIQVVFTSIPDNGEQLAKIDVLAMSGDLDIMPISNGAQFLRMENGVLAPLDAYIKRDGLNMESDFGSFADWVRHDGSYYCLPLRATMVGVYYNKDMFDAKGIPYPKDDWLLDDYIDVAKKMTSGSGQGKVYGTYIHTRGTEWVHSSLSGTNGAWYTPDGQINIRSPALQRALSLRRELDEGGYQMSFNQINAGRTLANAELLSGRCAMAIAGSWLTRDMKDKARFPFDFRVGIAYLPRYDRNTASRIVDMSVSTIGIPANSKHKDEAWEFIKYYVTKHSSVIAESGNVPCYIPAWTNDVVDIYVQGSGLSVEDGRKFFDPTATILSAFPIGPKNTQYLQILNEEVTLYFNGERSLEQITSSIESKYKALK